MNYPKHHCMRATCNSVIKFCYVGVCPNLGAGVKYISLTKDCIGENLIKEDSGGLLKTATLV